MKIRKYENLDWKLVHNMLSESMDYHLALPGILRFVASSKKLISDYLKSMIATMSSGRGMLYVAEEGQGDDAKVVGFIYGEELKHSREVTKLIKKECVITEIFIDVDYRNKGIASELLKATEIYFSKVGCKVIRLKDVNPNNVSANRLYKKLGYSVRVLEYIKEI
jgi:ribosomal protein S18 acetylase RimI-like enzyme